MKELGHTWSVEIVEETEGKEGDQVEDIFTFHQRYVHI
jgi:hypothetical protein